MESNAGLLAILCGLIYLLGTVFIYLGNSPKEYLNWARRNKLEAFAGLTYSNPLFWFCIVVSTFLINTWVGIISFTIGLITFFATYPKGLGFDINNPPPRLKLPQD